MTTFSYIGGTALAGLLDGALAGQMGRQSMQLLRQQIGDALAAYDGGQRTPGWPTAIGSLPPFEGNFTVQSQVQRLRDAHAQLGTMIAV